MQIPFPHLGRLEENTFFCLFHCCIFVLISYLFPLMRRIISIWQQPMLLQSDINTIARLTNLFDMRCIFKCTYLQVAPTQRDIMPPITDAEICLASSNYRLDHFFFQLQPSILSGSKCNNKVLHRVISPRGWTMFHTS